jgi:hypothetical protein
VLKDGLSMAKAFLGPHQCLTQMTQILTAPVLEFAAFEQIPHLLLRVQLRSVGRQAFQTHALTDLTGEKRFDDVRTMDGRAISNDQDWPCDLA